MPFEMLSRELPFVAAWDLVPNCEGEKVGIVEQKERPMTRGRRRQLP